MNNKRTASSGWMTWLLWVIASMVGFSIGMGASEIASNQIGEMAAALVFGLITGLLQWMVVRKLIRPAGWWLVANGLGIPLGFAATNLLHSLLLWPGPSFQDYALGFGLVGVLVGMAQWLILRSHFRKAGWWILISTTCWLLGGIIIWVMDLPWSEFIKITACYALLGLIVGIGTGLGSLLLKRSPTLPEIKRIKPVGNLTLAACALAFIFSSNAVARSFNTPKTMPNLDFQDECNDLPVLECSGDEAYCTELVPFEPVLGVGYSNDPVNGETWEDQYRSYVRREVMMAIQYAAAKVYCKTEGWDNSPLAVIGLGDMSEADGSIPGTSLGYSAHPIGTHQDGNDIDVAYYQGGGASTRLEASASSLRAVCKHSKFGIFVFHCTETPRLFDAWRTALFIASLAEHPLLRVIGVDGQVGPEIEAALDQLVESGWVNAGLRSEIPLAYETIDEGMGWYLYHYHHMHISMTTK